jgi:hypothetical protein
LNTDPKRSGKGGGVFWCDLAPTDHVCQMYGDESCLMEALVGFVASGLAADEATIVIATEEHIASLTRHLQALGEDVDEAIARDRLIAIPAAAMLARFMVDGWPDERAFAGCVGDAIARARARGRRVRAFGEMVALLWERGHYAATLRLEELWNLLVQLERFPVFCAYPKSGFARGRWDAIRELGVLHTKIIAA